MLSFQVDKKLSSRSFVGVRYERSAFILEVSGEADTDALLFTYERNLDRKSDLEFTVGAYSTRGTAVVNCDDVLTEIGCEVGQVTGRASDRTRGIQGDVTFNRRYRAHTIRVRAGHRPSAGGALLGATRFSWVQVSLNLREERCNLALEHRPSLGLARPARRQSLRPADHNPRR